MKPFNNSIREYDYYNLTFCNRLSMIFNTWNRTSDGAVPRIIQLLSHTVASQPKCCNQFFDTKEWCDINHLTRTPLRKTREQRLDHERNQSSAGSPTLVFRIKTNAPRLSSKLCINMKHHGHAMNCTFLIQCANADILLFRDSQSASTATATNPKSGATSQHL